MTAQIRERLFFNGKKYGMATEPLNVYLQQNNIMLEDEIYCTACWRNYIGTWTIKDNKLYLTELRLFSEEENINNEGVAAFLVSSKDEAGNATSSKSDTLMERLFPNQKEVFADWFSGEVRIPCGKMLEYIHMGYASIYEKDLVLVFEKGALVEQYEVDNTNKYQERLREREQKERKFMEAINLLKLVKKALHHLN